MSTASRTARKTTRSEVAGVNPLVLANCAQLSQMATKDVAKLARSASCRLVVDGESVFKQGDVADSVYVLLDGALRFEHGDEQGTSGHVVEAAYSTFGDIVLLGEETRRYTATATRDSMVVEIPLEAVLAAIEMNQRQGVAWRGSIMARLHRLEPQASESFGWRILHRLSQLTDAA